MPCSEIDSTRFLLVKADAFLCVCARASCKRVVRTDSLMNACMHYSAAICMANLNLI